MDYIHMTVYQKSLQTKFHRHMVIDFENKMAWNLQNFQFWPIFYP